MYRQGSLEQYVQDAAARKPAPGGGSVSGLVGALAAAMGEMAANFTVGNEKFAAVEARVRGMLERLSAARQALLELMERDIEAYSAVSAAYAMPRKTDDERAARRLAIGEALRGAMEAPLDVMRRCAEVGAIAAELASAGNPNLITDVGVSALLARAACRAARLNVEVNLKFLRQPELAERTRAEMDRLEAELCRRTESALARVWAYLNE